MTQTLSSHSTAAPAAPEDHAAPDVPASAAPAAAAPEHDGTAASYDTAASPGPAAAVRRDLPLARRPRRALVVREPSPRVAARRLRRTAPRTTARTWRKQGLPGPATATAYATLPEVLFGAVVVGLLFVPVVVWTQAATGAFVALGAALLGVAYLAWARRVVVGEDFVAVRQLGRYHVASADHVRHLELRAMQRGALCLHTNDGRSMLLRRVELEQPGISEALRDLADCGSSTRDSRVCAALSLQEDTDRLLDRYLPTAA